MEYSCVENKDKTKVEIHDLLKDHFTNGICKVNPSLRFRYLAIFCNVHTSALLKYNKVCTLVCYNATQDLTVRRPNARQPMKRPIT